MMRLARSLLLSIFVLSCSTKSDLSPSAVSAAADGNGGGAGINKSDGRAAVSSTRGLAAADGSSTLCGGVANTSSGLIYLHGMDTFEPSIQELGNRQILQDVANLLNLKIAMPRATLNCPQNPKQICWGWTFDERERTNIFSKITEAATTCGLDLKNSVVVGFSNGGHAVNALFEHCKLDVLKLSVSSGAAKFSGQLPPETPPLTGCGSLVLLTGTNDRFNFDPSHNLERQLLAKGANTIEVDFDGGHVLSEKALLSALSEKIYRSDETKPEH